MRESRRVAYRIAEDGMHLALKRAAIQRHSSFQRLVDVGRQRPQ